MMSGTPTDNLAAALSYAARKWFVIPAPQGEKKSHKSALHSGGQNWGATTDPKEIIQDWASWPNANVAIATGTISGVFVIDCDTADAHGADGVTALQDLASEHGGLPKTPMARTPTGGVHFYFKMPEGSKIKSNSGKIAPGIDVRGDGGMVLAPPSVKSGVGTYEWIQSPEESEIAECPDWLLKDIVAPQGPPGGKQKGSSEPPFIATISVPHLTKLLSYIDPDEGGYDRWLQILMAIHSTTVGGAAGLKLADDWSALGSKYVPGEVASKWSGFKSDGGIGFGTIAMRARENGADLSKIAQLHMPGEYSLAPSWAHAQGGQATKPNISLAVADGSDLSHDALAVDLGAHDWDHNAKYVALWGSWAFWCGSHWKIDVQLDHLTQVRKYLRKRAEELIKQAQATSSGSTNERRLQAVKSQAQRLRSKDTVTAVETLARSNPASVAQPSDFDRELMLIGTPGGVVDLRTGELRAARPEDMITKLTAVTPAPPGSQPERWLSYMDQVSGGNAEFIHFLQRAAGYALTGSTCEHILLFLFGSGRNGKSVFLNTLLELWGDYGRKVPATTFLHSQTERHPTDIAGLRGARLAIASELPRGKVWDEALIKDLTGGDRMTARFMRQDFFDFDPQLTLLIAGNTLPTFRGVDEAIRARVILVPFSVTIPPDQRDPQLPEKLRAEGPKILRWAIEGALAWQAQGINVPTSIISASKEYFDGEDTLGQFILDETFPEIGAFVLSDALHHRFVTWCVQQGHGPWPKTALVKELKSRGYQQARRKHGRGFANLQLQLGDKGDGF